MCGICGIVSPTGDARVMQATLVRMCQRLRHRGPDDEGYYLGQGAGLGMRRLSIIDPLTGRQPITNENKSLWLVFNGELYNYRTIRADLERKGHCFHTQSDSEVVIHAYEEYGERCLDQFNGMFAFAIWDTRVRRLFLARDRLGIKPLYYWLGNDQIVFGSELKAVIAHRDVGREIDLVALNDFLTLEYIAGPRTIFQGIYKLLPGHWLAFQDGTVQVEPYWDIPHQGVATSEQDAIEALSELIHDAVRMQLVSDVPLGMFLSGGIDSSSVLAAMSRATSEPVRTFSIGFADATYNELPYARAVAAHFGAQHVEARLEPDIANLAAKLIAHLDEPFADFSIFPTYLVSNLAGAFVKVVLTGDGGDELFGGYDTYVAQQYDRFYHRLPAVLRHRLFPTLTSWLPPQPAKKGVINKTKRFVEGAALPVSLQHVRWMMFLNEAEKGALYGPAVRDRLNGRDASVATRFEDYFQQAAPFEALAQQQYVDIKTYLVDDILVKVDRMSMAASIEARVPLLDHRIVEFAVNLPSRLKLHRGRTKVILRQAMKDQLPPMVLNKPKEGFSIPLKHWLRGPLRPLMMELLSADAIQSRGYFSADCVAGWISDHLAERANRSHQLWALMVFELWHRNLACT